MYPLMDAWTSEALIERNALKAMIGVCRTNPYVLSDFSFLSVSAVPVLISRSNQAIMGQ